MLTNARVTKVEEGGRAFVQPTTEGGGLRTSDSYRVRGTHQLQVGDPVSVSLASSETVRLRDR